MAENGDTPGETSEDTQKHTAGLFDIRFIIGSLIGIYGAITLVTGLFTSDAQLDKADGININILAGIGMLVVAAGFALWARLRPIVVAGDAGAEDADTRPSH